MGTAINREAEKNGYIALRATPCVAHATTRTAYFLEVPNDKLLCESEGSKAIIKVVPLALLEMPIFRLIQIKDAWFYG